MGIKNLCLIFGMVPSVFSEVINKMLQVIIRKKNRQPFTRISFLNLEKMAYFAGLIQAEKLT
jgi:hypothetical protein